MLEKNNQPERLNSFLNYFRHRS